MSSRDIHRPLNIIQNELAIERFPEAAKIAEVGGQKEPLLMSVAAIAAYVGHMGLAHEIARSRDNSHRRSFVLANIGHVVRDESYALEAINESHHSRTVDYRLSRDFVPVEQQRHYTPHMRRVDHGNEMMSTAVDLWGVFPESEILSSFVARVARHHKAKLTDEHHLLLAGMVSDPAKAYSTLVGMLHSSVAQESDATLLKLFRGTGDSNFLIRAAQRTSYRYHEDLEPSRSIYHALKDLGFQKQAKEYADRVAENAQAYIGQEQAIEYYDALVASSHPAKVGLQDKVAVNLNQVFADDNPVRRRKNMLEAYSSLANDIHERMLGQPITPPHKDAFGADKRPMLQRLADYLVGNS